MSLPSSDTPLCSADAQALVADAVRSGRLEAAEARRLAYNLGAPGVLEALLAGASESKRIGKGDVVTVSRNIFIPLTNLCRDRCAYCTFAKPSDSPEAKTYELEEVEDLVRGGVATGCIEALMCLGDKPEIAYKSHRDWLASRGFGTTADYVEAACKVAFEGKMLPHTNAGILSQEEMERLRPWNASMGLMLENVSPRLRERGMPHYHAPDKDPEVRLRMHREAGESKIPFTTGLLLGIGENEDERIDSLLAIRELQERYGHIQEVIMQPFHPKPSIKMRAASSLRDEEVAGWVALSRLMLGPQMNIQAPPNLAPKMLELLLRSGLNDWGGVSPVTLDFINPEAPWPTLRVLRERTEAAGQRLLERLPVYPEFIVASIRESKDGRPGSQSDSKSDFFDPQMRVALPRFATDEGYARPNVHQSGEEAA